MGKSPKITATSQTFGPQTVDLGGSTFSKATVVREVVVAAGQSI